MAFLSDALARIKPSPTVAITAHALRLKAEGRDIISLAAGEPDFDTPANIRDAAKAAIDRGETRYTAPEGIPELRRAIAAKFARENRLDYAPDAGHRLDRRQAGAVQRAARHAEPRRRGDHPRALLGQLSRHGARSPAARRSIVAGRLENGFKITPEALDAAITPRTKWLIFNSPSNPTGAGYSRGRAQGADRRAPRASRTSG